MKSINNMDIEFPYFTTPKKEMHMRLIPLKSFIFHFPILPPPKGGYIPGEIGLGYISPLPFRGRQIVRFFPFEVSR
jgi:hypothetical protein